jgi:hypothetical protein
MGGRGYGNIEALYAMKYLVSVCKLKNKINYKN